jgi:hypothetical protein
MKFKTMIIATFCHAVLASSAMAQTPDGFTKGSVTLANGNTINGFVKNTLKKNASIQFVETGTSKKNVYDGKQLNGVTIDNTNYMCKNGDFFSIIIDGKINFLQKASDASSNVTYNGADAMFNAGTEGKIGDYFVLSSNQLKRITKKTINTFITDDLANCTAAIEKAKTINGDVSALADAVNIFNTTCGK